MADFVMRRRIVDPRAGKVLAEAGERPDTETMERIYWLLGEDPQSAKDCLNPDDPALVLA